MIFPHRKAGFTVVELIIVISVIGILAAITIVAYSGVRERAANATVQSDLEHATGLLESASLKDGGKYPVVLPDDIAPSAHVSLALGGVSLAHYSSLSVVQNGVLLSQICHDLIDEGLGRGTDKGGSSNDYVIGCGNWNHDSFQVTGWQTKVFSTAVTAQDLTDAADNAPDGGIWHNEEQSVVAGFYTTMRNRFIIQGGSYPVTSFWDSWANSTNGGVIKKDLPAPDASLTSTYCLQGTHNQYPGIIWHVTQDNRIENGAC